MADQRRLLWRLTTRPGMILCPVDNADRGRMMSASLRGHGGSGVSTPCRSDRRPGGSVWPPTGSRSSGKGIWDRSGRWARATGTSATNRRLWCFGKGYSGLAIGYVCRAAVRWWTDVMPRNFSNAFWFFRTNRFAESVLRFCSSAEFSHTVVARDRGTAVTIYKYMYNTQYARYSHCL